MQESITSANNHKYDITHELGQGVTAVVYLAEHATFGQVVLKKCRRDIAANRKAAFNSEAMVLRSLKAGLEQRGLPPLVPVVYDYEVNELLVTSAARGKPLVDWLRDQISPPPKASRGLPETEVVVIMHQISQLFQVLHEQVKQSYLDFQFQNFFWDRASQQVTVIDWNHLAALEDKEKNYSYRDDLKRLGQLLYLLLFNLQADGGAAFEQVRLRAGERWQSLSEGLQVVLQRAWYSQSAEVGYANIAAMQQDLAELKTAWHGNDNETLNQLAIKWLKAIEGVTDKSLLQAHQAKLSMLQEILNKRAAQAKVEGHEADEVAFKLTHGLLKKQLPELEGDDKKLLFAMILFNQRAYQQAASEWRTLAERSGHLELWRKVQVAQAVAEVADKQPDKLDTAQEALINALELLDRGKWAIALQELKSYQGLTAIQPLILELRWRSQIEQAENGLTIGAKLEAYKKIDLGVMTPDKLPYYADLVAIETGKFNPAVVRLRQEQLQEILAEEAKFQPSWDKLNNDLKQQPGLEPEALVAFLNAEPRFKPEAMEKEVVQLAIRRANQTADVAKARCWLETIFQHITQPGALSDEFYGLWSELQQCQKVAEGIKQTDQWQMERVLETLEKLPPQWEQRERFITQLKTDLTKMVGELTTQQSSLTQAVTELTSQKIDLAEAINNLNAEESNLKQVIAEMTSHKGQLEQEVKKVTSHKIDLDKAMEQLRTLAKNRLQQVDGQLKAKNGELEQIETLLTAQKVEQQQVVNDLHAKQVELTHVVKDLETQQIEVVNIVNNLEAKQTELNKLEHEINDRCEYAELLQKEIDELVNKDETLVSQKTSLEQNVIELTAQKTSLEQYVYGFISDIRVKTSKLEQVITEFTAQRTELEQGESDNWQEAQEAYYKAQYGLACSYADAVVKKNGILKAQAELLWARSRALELYNNNQAQWTLPSAVSEIKQVCEEIARILLPTNLDDRTKPVYENVFLRLNQLKQLEFQDDIIHLQLENIRLLLAQAKVSRGMQQAHRYQNAYEKIVPLLSQATTLSEERKTLFDEIVKNWLTLLKNHVDACFASKTDEVLVETTWQMGKAISDQGLLVEEYDLQEEFNLIEWHYWQQKVADNSTKPADVLNCYEILLNLAKKPSDKKQLQQARHEFKLRDLIRQVEETLRLGLKMEAISFLDTKLNEREFAGEPLLIEKLLGLYLADSKFGEAGRLVEQIKVGSKYPNPAQSQKMWQGFIESKAYFTHNQYDDGLAMLAQLKGDFTGTTFGTIIEEYEQELKDEATRVLLREAQQIRDSQPLEAIKKYQQILTLLPNHRVAQAGLKQLGAKINELLQEIEHRFIELTVVTAEQLPELITQAQRLLEQVTAVEAAKTLLGLDKTGMAILSDSQKVLTEKIRLWQRILQKPAEFEKHKADALRGSWKFDMAWKSLNQEVELCQSEQVLVYAVNKRRGELGQLTQIAAMLAENCHKLKTVIDQEQFEEVIQQCQILDMEWSKAKGLRFSGLEWHIEYTYYNMSGEMVNDLAQHRAIAQMQLENLKVWEEWVNRFIGLNDLQTEWQKLQTEVLSEAEFNKKLAVWQGKCQDFQTLLTNPPGDCLSEKAEEQQRKLNPTRIKQVLDGWQLESQELAHTVQQQTEDIKNKCNIKLDHLNHQIHKLKLLVKKKKVVVNFLEALQQQVSTAMKSFISVGVRDYNVLELIDKLSFLLDLMLDKPNSILDYQIKELIRVAELLGQQINETGQGKLPRIKLTEFEPNPPFFGDWTWFDLSILLIGIAFFGLICSGLFFFYSWVFSPTPASKITMATVIATNTPSSVVITVPTVFVLTPTATVAVTPTPIAATILTATNTPSSVTIATPTLLPTPLVGDPTATPAPFLRLNPLSNRSGFDWPHVINGTISSTTEITPNDLTVTVMDGDKVIAGTTLITPAEGAISWTWTLNLTDDWTLPTPGEHALNVAVLAGDKVLAITQSWTISAPFKSKVVSGPYSLLILRPIFNQNKGTTLCENTPVSILGQQKYAFNNVLINVAYVVLENGSRGWINLATDVYITNVDRANIPVVSPQDMPEPRLPEQDCQVIPEPTPIRATITIFNTDFRAAALELNGTIESNQPPISRFEVELLDAQGAPGIVAGIFMPPLLASNGEYGAWGWQATSPITQTGNFTLIIMIDGNLVLTKEIALQ